MEFVSVRELRNRPGEVWKRLFQAGEIVVTSNGKPIALLSGITEATLEPTLTALREIRARRAVSRLRTSAQARGVSTLPASEVDGEVAAARRSRRRSGRKRR